MTRTTQMIEVGRCVTNKFQPRSRGRRSVEGLARNIQANGQLTPITVVADGEGAYQVVYGHRRLAAMKSIGERWIEAYVEDSWEDAVMARRLNAENYDRAEPTAGETAEGIQAMLQLGVPVTQVAASCSMDVTKVRDFARGAMRVPEADGAASFDALVKIGEHRDVLTDEDVNAIMAAEFTWEMDSVCRKAEGRANEARLAAQLAREGVRVVSCSDIDYETMRPHDGEGERAGLFAFIEVGYWGDAEAHFYRELTAGEIAAEEEARAQAAAARAADMEAEPDPEPEETHPTPEEIEADARYESRRAALAELDAHVTEFAKRVYGKFPSGSGHSKLRKWAHEAFAARYGEPDEAWSGVKKPKGGMVDRFVLMRTVPECLPHVGDYVMRDGWELSGYDAERVEAFLHFHTEVLAFARYRPTEEEAELFGHLRSLLEGEAPEAEPADAGTGADGDGRPIVELAEAIVADAEAAEPAPELAMAA